MPTSDWKEPFLRFRDQIRPHFDAGVKLYHGILMAPFHEGHELEEVAKNQAAADLGKHLALTVETPTKDCKHHAHYFYGDNSTCTLLKHALSEVDNWILGIPKGLLPQFNPGCRGNTSGRELATWASLVCYLAWEIDAPYLQATVEYQSRIDEVTSVEWSLSPWPENCDPRPGLIHQGSTSEHFTEFLETFSDLEDDRWCPDIIGAYLRGEPFCRDFIEASITAVDVLIFMFEQIRTSGAPKQNELSSSIKRKNPRKSRRVSKDLILLKAFLRLHHDPNETLEKAHTALNADQIAEAMEWYSDSGKPLQSKVSRRMTELFGPNGMEVYKRLFVRGKVTPGFKRKMEDGTFEIEAIEDFDETENSEE